MFSFLMTESARARRDARNWLEVAEKVWHYRRDELTDPQLRDLQAQTHELKKRIKQRDDVSRLKLGMESLEAVLRKVGGRVYPKTSLTENVEFFLAAAIIILGVRAYIVQPFKIPTNSMWPSYNGMTHEVFADPADVPGPAARAGRFLAFGAMPRSVKAPVAGVVQVPFSIRDGKVPYSIVRARKWLVLPTDVREYQLLVGGQPAKVRVPLDFSGFDRIVQASFFNGRDDLAAVLNELARAGKAKETLFSRAPGSANSSERVILADVGTATAAGDAVLSFDILTGDQLFVDRVSYHFAKPSVGQGFVFRTGNIQGLGRSVRNAAGGYDYVAEDKYYVKRLVGLPGDKMEIRAPALYRNGSPITGAKAFERNAKKEGKYPGYTYAGTFTSGAVVTVPEGSFLALGDNSPDSYDGRSWGFVPEGDVIGRPIWIYYPLARRWGLAR
ncbi:MAG TPA: signal peptidase I [Opitutaceae bacterium]|nr:signal peptidase I [Opitutaceae bacterium]